MPKAKLTVKNSDNKKLNVAATYAGAKIVDSLQLGDETIHTISAGSAEAFFKAGRLIEKVTGSELDKKAEPKK